MAGSVLVPVSPPALGTVPQVPPFPLAVSLAGPLEAVADLALFVWMLVVAVSIGPWACRKTVAERPDLPVPTTA